MGAVNATLTVGAPDLAPGPVEGGWLSFMTTLAAIRERQRSARLVQLREGIAPLIRACPGASVLLFGSLARGDWDGFSDVDLLAIASTQAQASHLAEALLSAGLADDVIALSEARWRELQASGDPYWAAIGRDALALDPPSHPVLRPGSGRFRAIWPSPA